MKLVTLLLVLMGFSAQAQKSTDYRCAIFNEKMQKLNINDSSLNIELLLKASQLGVYILNKKDPKAKALILEMTITVIRVGEKFADFPMEGNRISEKDPVIAEIRLCQPGDRVYVDHISFKTADGKTSMMNKGFSFLLK